MCEKCDLIDYPVADVWRPCYVPRVQPRVIVMPPTPRGGFSDEDYDQQQKINSLMAIIRAQRAEISTLKAAQVKPDSLDSFEGLE